MSKLLQTGTKLRKKSTLPNGLVEITTDQFEDILENGLKNSSHTFFNKLAQLSPPPARKKFLSQKRGTYLIEEISTDKACSPVTWSKFAEQYPGIENFYLDRSIESIIKRCFANKVSIITYKKLDRWPWKQKILPRGQLVLVRKGDRSEQLLPVSDKVITAALKKIEQKEAAEKKKYDLTHADERKESEIENVAHDHIKLYRKAKAKFYSHNVITALTQIDSPLYNSYVNSWDCAAVLIQNGHKVTSKYCKQRWCITCNRIRTAQLMNGYVPELDQFEDAQFVTLTVPNVADYHLREMFDLMQTSWRWVYRKVKKKKIQKQRNIEKVSGLKKVECTYNPERHDFHPHYHLIVEGKNLANTITEFWYQWFYNMGVKLSWKAQMVKPVESKAGYLELFKYFTKIITNSKKDRNIYVAPLDQIFQAMYRKRTFEPFGIKKVSEDIDEIQSEEFAHLLHEERIWQWLENDWYSEGQSLTGYIPGDAVSKIFQNIVL